MTVNSLAVPVSDGREGTRLEEAEGLARDRLSNRRIGNKQPAPEQHRGASNDEQAFRPS